MILNTGHLDDFIMVVINVSLKFVSIFYSIRCRDCMVVRFMAIYAISVYHH